MELDPSQSTSASEPLSLDSVQDFVASFLRYLELLFVSVLLCFGGFVIMVGGLLALPDDAVLAVGMGLERPGTWRGASACQYWNRDNLQIQDCEAIFPRNRIRVSKRS